MSNRLTKSQYEWLAKDFRNTKPTLPKDYKLGEDSQRGRDFDVAYSQWYHDLQVLTHRLADFDEKFDYDKFYDLCGL